MRNFFIYARSRDNQFFSCSIIVNCQKGIEANELAEKIAEAARVRFMELGNPLPPVHELLRFRAVVDPRNDLDEGGYPYTPPQMGNRYKRVKS